MKRVIAAFVFLFMAPGIALAQNAEKSVQGQCYVFAAPIVSNTQYVFNTAYAGVVFPPNSTLPSDFFFHRHSGINTGFGFDVFGKAGIGGNVEAGYAAPDLNFDGGGGVGVVSIDASYHFLRKRNRKIEPFAVGGYSLYYGDRTATESGFNLGGGLNWWFSKHVGLRLEVRDQDHINYFHSQFTRFVAFRAGVTFR